MKKFIVAIDGLKYSVNTFKTAVYLANAAHAHLVGVFLEDLTYHSFKMHNLVGEEGASEDKISELEEKDARLRSEAVEDFQRICSHAGIDHTIHHDRSIAITELLHESVFADLIIINCNETLTHYSENRPTRFIRSLLSESQSPVLIIPDGYESIQSISFLYDGEVSSVHAIRTFSYLFPGLADTSCEVVTVDTRSKDRGLPHSYLMKEFMKRHFPWVRYTKLEGIPENELVKHFKDAEATMIVVGAYTRGTFSRWLKPSLADTLMQELNHPILVAHS